MAAPISASMTAKFDSNMMMVYLCAFIVGSLVYQSFNDLGVSTLMTLSVGLQCIGYVCLRLKISQQRSVAGISGKTLSLQALSCGLRLCSTTWLRGYIPSDSTGDWFYQFLDVLALVMCLQIMYCVFKSYNFTYQADDDVCNVKAIVLICFTLAVLVHPDLNNRPLFDTLWTTALYIDVVAMMPQLKMMTKISGEVEALTSHFVGATAVSRVVSLVFWYVAFQELAPLDGSFNMSGWTIMFAHVVQVLLFCDFLFYYVRACALSGYNTRLDLSSGFSI